MGEVVVRVKLTNLVDAELARRGDLRSARSLEVDAVVDTGAVRSVISQSVCDQLGLTVARQSPARLADGTVITAGVANGLMFEILGRETEAGAFVLGNEVLVGQTVLEEMDLLVDCAGHQVIPNPRNPDGPVLALRALGNQR